MIVQHPSNLHARRHVYELAGVQRYTQLASCEPRAAIIIERWYLCLHFQRIPTHNSQLYKYSADAYGNNNPRAPFSGGATRYKRQRNFNTGVICRSTRESLFSSWRLVIGYPKFSTAKRALYKRVKSVKSLMMPQNLFSYHRWFPEPLIVSGAQMVLLENVAKSGACSRYVSDCVVNGLIF